MTQCRGLLIRKLMRQLEDIEADPVPIIGKGKLTDILVDKFELCARAAGGNNAGMTSSEGGRNE